MDGTNFRQLDGGTSGLQASHVKIVTNNNKKRLLDVKFFHSDNLSAAQGTYEDDYC